MNHDKIQNLNWPLLIPVTLLVGTGWVMLYSAAGESLSPWAIKQIFRFFFALVLAITIAFIDIRIWLRFSYPIYFISLFLLALVPFFGSSGLGARRWLNVGEINIQPSELMKVTLVLALARYFHTLDPANLRKIPYFIPPILAIIVPALIVLQQPDLGTALVIILGGIMILFLAGIPFWFFIAGGAASILAVPVIWRGMESYQRSRVLIFLNPEGDPLGSGYHITQSKIALGSGGIFGKGLFQGTQSHLNFLPEKHTDFIFAMLAEELGMIGALAILSLYLIIFSSALKAGIRCRHQFGRILAVGMAFTIFLYVSVNTSMVMSLIPVVGVPLAPISYGGTSLVIFMIAIGFILNVHLHREAWFGRTGFTG